MICKYFQVIFNVLKTFVWFQKKMEEPAGDETTEGLIQDCKGNSFFSFCLKGLVVFGQKI